ncbi:MAG: serine--tRNA ligase, partial [Symploca sp. SIO2B6]|nr:serine--tRNA ligase [Symploca sp. SIO2B6]
MLDIRQIRDNLDDVQTRLSLRGEYDLASILELYEQQRSLDTQCSELQARSNSIGKEVGQKIKGGSDPKGTDVQALR